MRGLVRRLAGNYELPWLCVGDYNEILINDEKRGGNLHRDDRTWDFVPALKSVTCSI